MLEAAAAAGRATSVHFNESSKLAIYIERLGLRRIIEECGASSSKFPPIYHHAPGSRFVELTRFGLSGDSVIEDVCRTLVHATCGPRQLVARER